MASPNATSPQAEREIFRRRVMERDHHVVDDPRGHDDVEFCTLMPAIVGAELVEH